jgi:hypothetical protein
VGFYNEIVERIVSNCSRELIKLLNSLAEFDSLV